MSIYSSGRKLEGFFTGKGFYIVLFLCAAVIGLSAWMMAAGNETMDKLEQSSISFDNSTFQSAVIYAVLQLIEIMLNCIDINFGKCSEISAQIYHLNYKIKDFL